MEKTTEEKIDEINKAVLVIHDSVLTLTIQFEAYKTACKLKHEGIDKSIEEQDKALFGNGRPGIIDRFNTFENRAIAYTVAAVMIMQILGPKISKAIGL